MCIWQLTLCSTQKTFLWKIKKHLRRFNMWDHRTILEEKPPILLTHQIKICNLPWFSHCWVKERRNGTNEQSEAVATKEDTRIESIIISIVFAQGTTAQYPQRRKRQRGRNMHFRFVKFSQKRVSQTRQFTSRFIRESTTSAGSMSGKCKFKRNPLKSVRNWLQLCRVQIQLSLSTLFAVYFWFWRWRRKRVVVV